MLCSAADLVELKKHEVCMQTSIPLVAIIPCLYVIFEQENLSEEDRAVLNQLLSAHEATNTVHLR